MCKFFQAGCLIFVIVFCLVTDFELGTNVSCEESTVSPILGYIIYSKSAVVVDKGEITSQRCCEV